MATLEKTFTKAAIILMLVEEYAKTLPPYYLKDEPILVDLFDNHGESGYSFGIVYSSSAASGKNVNRTVFVYEQRNADYIVLLPSNKINRDEVSKEQCDYREFLKSEEYTKAAERVLELLYSNNMIVRKKFEDERRKIEKGIRKSKSKSKKVAECEIETAMNISLLDAAKDYRARTEEGLKESLDAVTKALEKARDKKDKQTEGWIDVIRKGK